MLLLLFQIIFHSNIANNALKAAIDYVQKSTQHTCHIAERNTIAEEIKVCNTGNLLLHLKVHNTDKPNQQLDNPDIAGYTILFPGKKLDISALVKAKNSKTKATSQQL